MFNLPELRQLYNVSEDRLCHKCELTYKLMPNESDWYFTKLLWWTFFVWLAAV